MVACLQQSNFWQSVVWQLTFVGAVGPTAEDCVAALISGVLVHAARLEITPWGNEICSTQNLLPRGNYPNYLGNKNYPGNYPWGNVFLWCPKTLPR